MKKTLLLLACAAFVFSTGCQKIKSLATISIDMPFGATDSTILPANIADSLKGATAINVDLNLPALAFPTYIQQNLDSFNTKPSEVLAASLKELKIQLNNGGSFNFVDSVTVILSAKYQPAIVVATNAPIDSKSGLLSFNVNNDLDLKQYFLQDTIYIALTAHFIALPPASTSMAFLGKFHITANPLDQ